MKKILKVMWTVSWELLLFPVSVLIWALAFLYALWCNKLDKDQWHNDFVWIRIHLKKYWQGRLLWINA